MEIWLMPGPLWSTILYLFEAVFCTALFFIPTDTLKAPDSPHACEMFIRRSLWKCQLKQEMNI